MEKYSTRNDIPNEYKWDLSYLFKDEDSFNNALEKVTKRINNYQSYDKDINKNADNLYNAIKEFYDMYNELINVYMYAKLHYDLDKADSININRKQKVDNLLSLFSVNTSFLAIKIKKIKNINMFYSQNSKLREYKHQLDEIIRTKKHILSLKEELVLSETSLVRNASHTIFSDLHNTDVDYGYITLEDGSKVKLTESLIYKIRTEFNRKLRKKAFEMQFGYLEKFKNTFASIYLMNVKNDNVNAKLRGYKSALVSSLDDDFISEKVYSNLVKSVHNNIDKLHRYIKIKKEALNIKDFSMYDIYVPLNHEIEKTYTFDECKEIVKEALKILGDDYYQVAFKSFTDNWYDVYETKAKETGAYSSSGYTTKPHILLNFASKHRDVETIAHELGHSMHSYYSNKYNPIQDSEYPIFLAEIASNVNEVLLANYELQHSKDNNEKKQVLETLLEGFRTSIYRQTQFAEFESIIHTKEQNHEDLSVKEITDVYYDLNKFYYGKDIIHNDLIRYECLGVPHFYYNFYVYKYATGLSIAHVFASRIINHEEHALENYLEFLKSGGKDYPLEILKKCNIDLTNTKLFDETFKLFDYYMDEYEKLS